MNDNESRVPEIRPAKWVGVHRDPAQRGEFVRDLAQAMAGYGAPKFTTRQAKRALTAVFGVLALLLVFLMLNPSGPVWAGPTQQVGAPVAPVPDVTARALEDDAYYRALWCTGNSRTFATDQLKRAAAVLHQPYRAPTTAADCTPAPSPTPTATGSPGPSPSVPGSPTPSPSTVPPSPSTSPSTSPAPSPTASSSPTGSPTPTGGPMLDCMRRTDRCGYPTAATTGPHDTVALTTYSGPWPFRMKANMIYRNLYIPGCVFVEGSYSQLIDSLVRPNASTLCGGWGAIDVERNVPLTGVKFSYVEVDLSWTGANRFNLRAISGDGFELDHVHCHDGGDCVHYGGDIYMHDSAFEVPQCTVAPAGQDCSDLHIDALHSAPGHPDPAKRRVWIEHNTAYVAGSDPAINATSAIINGPDLISYESTFPQSDVHFIDNVIGGGQWSAYCEAHRGQIYSVPMVEFRDNRVSDIWWPLGGRYGPTTDCKNNVPIYSGNVMDRTGQAI